MADPQTPHDGSTAPREGGRYRRLPEPVRLEDTITSTDPGPTPDPTAGRDPERDFFLRYLA